MTCSSCHRSLPSVRLVVRAHRSGFGYTTRRFHACLSCFPEPAAPAASSSPVPPETVLPTTPPSVVGVAGLDSEWRS